MSSMVNMTPIESNAIATMFILRDRAGARYFGGTHTPVLQMISYSDESDEVFGSGIDACVHASMPCGMPA
jgi:hypothetical protein